MVAHEGASLVRLVKWPILPVEILAHRHLKFMDTCLLNIINELDLHTPCKSEKVRDNLLDCLCVLFVGL